MSGRSNSITLQLNGTFQWDHLQSLHHPLLFKLMYALAWAKDKVFKVGDTLVTPPTAAMANEFWVGGASGWTVGHDYQAWAKDEVFKVGDTLGQFIYG
ncbi:unnamed protein product [Ilex paraguariensis]|uniref:Uncharacterized protein n=1 Tax=Ilex paraguariensis TaxID=185542 RepID=A0ABC8UJ57_9AQUA